MSVALLLTNNLDNSSKGGPAFLAQLHLPTHDLFWAKLRSQLRLPPLRSLDLLISPGALKEEGEDPLLLSAEQVRLYNNYSFAGFAYGKLDSAFLIRVILVW